MAVIALAILVGLVLIVVSIANPLVRRIGVRNALRRPREAALVMLGCLLGTALIVGSSAVGSSYTASIQDQALGELGQIDATVTYENRDDWAAGNARLVAEPVADIELAAAAATVVVPLTSDSSVDPAPDATLIEADYRRVTKLLNGDGTGPIAGTAWASPALAEKLNLKVGSIVTVHTRAPVQIDITRITASSLAKFTANSTDAGFNLLVAPGTVATLEAQDPERITPRWLTLVGATGPHSVAPPASALVQQLERELTDLLTPYNPRISMVRAERLERAIDVGRASSQFLTTIGAFGILAGALLLINVLLMLAEERLAELGTMRAVGLGRGPLIAAFTIEGAIYALVGSIIGAVGGVGLGRFMVWIAQNAGAPRSPFASAANQLHLRFSVDLATVGRGMAAGFLLSTLVAAATSFRISRLDVIRSLRGLPDPPIPHRRAATPALWAMIVVGAIVSVSAYAGRNSLMLIVAPTLVTTALGVLVARRFGWKAGVTAACIPNIVWAVVFQIVNNATDVASSAIVVGGILLVTSGVLLVNAHQSTAAHFLRRVGRGRITVTSRLGLANPLAHRVRTLLTVGPFALVVFTLAYAEGLSGLISSELRGLAPTLAGDYQVYARSSPVSPFDFSKIDASSVDAIAPVSTLVASFNGGTSTEQRFWTMTAFDKDLADQTPPRLVSRGKEFKDDAAVFSAVADDPDLVIVPGNFLFTAGQRLGRTKGDPTRTPRVGDVYTMFDAVNGQSRDLTVAGVGYADVLGIGALYGVDGAREFFGARLVASGALIDARVDPDSLVKQLNQAGVTNGMDAAVVEDLANQQFEFVSNIVNLYRSDLGIGIVVGVAGIGVVLIRSVRDRRRQIGTLRAMGFDSAQIGWSFLLEGGFVAAQGLAVGAGLGSVMVMGLARSTQIRDVLGFYPSIPMPSLSLMVLTVLLLGASLLASAGPARSASRIPPAVALRLVD